MGAPGTTEGPWAAIKGAEEGDEMRCAVVATRGDRAYLVATIESGAPGDFCDTEFANAHQMAASGALYDALVEARDQFLFYEQRHLAKYSERDLDLVRKGIVDVPMGRDAYEKALVNADMAAMCDDALAQAPTPDRRGMAGEE